MDMIELLARCIGVEPIAADIAKMAVRNMDDQFLDEFDGRLDDIITLFIFVIMIIPMDDIGLFIKTDDAAFSDAGPAGITHIVDNARVDVVAVIFVFKFFIFFLGPGIDIKAFGMFFVQDGSGAFERGPDLFLDEAQ